MISMILLSFSLQWVSARSSMCFKFNQIQFYLSSFRQLHTIPRIDLTGLPMTMRVFTWKSGLQPHVGFPSNKRKHHQFCEPRSLYEQAVGDMEFYGFLLVGHLRLAARSMPYQSCCTLCLFPDIPSPTYCSWPLQWNSVSCCLFSAQLSRSCLRFK